MQLQIGNYSDLVAAVHALTSKPTVYFFDGTGGGGTFDILIISELERVFFWSQFHGTSAPSAAQVKSDFPNAIQSTNGGLTPTSFS